MICHFERDSTDLTADPGMGMGYFTMLQVAAAVFRAVPDLQRLTLREIEWWKLEIRTPGFDMPPEAVELVNEKRAVGMLFIYSSALG